MGKRWKDAEEFKKTVRAWAGKVKVAVGEIHLRPMNNKWASYSTGTRRLTFDSGLLKKDRKFGEYVILHEVLHIKIPNHGKLFKSLLSAYMPEYRQPADTKLN